MSTSPGRGGLLPAVRSRFAAAHPEASLRLRQVGWGTRRPGSRTAAATWRSSGCRCRTRNGTTTWWSHRSRGWWRSPVAPAGRAGRRGGLRRPAGRALPRAAGRGGRAAGLLARHGRARGPPAAGRRGGGEHGGDVRGADRGPRVHDRPRACSPSASRTFRPAAPPSLYDALGYSLVHTLKPLRGERTGIVILSDGDDNRSFLPFNSHRRGRLRDGRARLPALRPLGAHPLFERARGAPRRSTRCARASSRSPRAPTRRGARLAEVSGGVYYPITRLEQLQRAYDDVAAQLRTAYTITYEIGRADARPDARVRVRVAREGASVRLSPAVGVSADRAPPRRELFEELQGAR